MAQPHEFHHPAQLALPTPDPKAEGGPQTSLSFTYRLFIDDETQNVAVRTVRFTPPVRPRPTPEHLAEDAPEQEPRWRSTAGFFLIPIESSSSNAYHQESLHRMLAFLFALPDDLAWSLQLRIDTFPPDPDQPDAEPVTMIYLIAAATGDSPEAAALGLARILDALAIASVMIETHALCAFKDEATITCVQDGFPDIDVIEVCPPEFALTRLAPRTSVPLELPPRDTNGRLLMLALANEARRTGRRITWITTLSDLHDHFQRSTAIWDLISEASRRIGPESSPIPTATGLDYHQVRTALLSYAAALSKPTVHVQSFLCADETISPAMISAIRAECSAVPRSSEESAIFSHVERALRPTELRRIGENIASLAVREWAANSLFFPENSATPRPHRFTIEQAANRFWFPVPPYSGVQQPSNDADDDERPAQSPASSSPVNIPVDTD